MILHFPLIQMSSHFFCRPLGNAAGFFRALVLHPELPEALNPISLAEVIYDLCVDLARRSMRALEPKKLHECDVAAWQQGIG